MSCQNQRETTARQTVQQHAQTRSVLVVVVVICTLCFQASECVTWRSGRKKLVVVVVVLVVVVVVVVCMSYVDRQVSVT